MFTVFNPEFYASFPLQIDTVAHNFQHSLLLVILIIKVGKYTDEGVC